MGECVYVAVYATAHNTRVLFHAPDSTSLAALPGPSNSESGIAHLHVLLGAYIPQQWLSAAWQSIGGGRIVDIRYVDIHRVTAYLACYLTGQKVEHTLFFLPNRARIFTTSRSIVLWGKKKEASGWWLRKKSVSELRDAVGIAYKERYEATEDLKRFGLESLTYFEGPLEQISIGNRDPSLFSKSLSRFGRQRRFKYAMA